MCGLTFDLIHAHTNVVGVHTYAHHSVGHHAPPQIKVTNSMPTEMYATAA